MYLNVTTFCLIFLNQVTNISADIQWTLSIMDILRPHFLLVLCHEKNGPGKTVAASKWTKNWSG